MRVALFAEPKGVECGIAVRRTIERREEEEEEEEAGGRRRKRACWKAETNGREDGMNLPLGYDLKSADVMTTMRGAPP